MERARWWQRQLGLTEEEWEDLVSPYPELDTTHAVGCSRNGILYITLFLSGPLDLLDMIDCWLHEYLEITFLDEVNNHEAFDKTVTGIARYVSSP